MQETREDYNDAVSAEFVENSAEALVPPMPAGQVRQAPNERPPGLTCWPVPSSLCNDPGEARSAIVLPDFDPLLLEKARVISSRYPLAEGELKVRRKVDPNSLEPELPHFEKVFRIAATLASVRNVQDSPDYDTLLILTAWHSVRPGVNGFLGSYPKALLCPLSHLAPPTALSTLSTRDLWIFEKRAP